MKKSIICGAIVGLVLGLTAIVRPDVMHMVLGTTTPQVVVAKVGSTSKSYHVPASWTRVHCPDQAVYYTTGATAPTATTSSTPLPANQPVYVNNNTNQFFAFLEKGKGPGKCYLETVQNSFTTATVTGAADFQSTVAITGQTTMSGYLSGVDAGFNNITATGNETVSGTLSVTGASTLTGEATFAGYLSGKDAGVNNLTATGNGTISGTLGVTGASTLTGEATFVAYLSGKDAGVNNLTATGNASVSGSLTNSGDNLIGGGTKTRGTMIIGGTGTVTATVNSGAFCLCSNGTDAGAAVGCAVSGTTLTATGVEANTIHYFCVQ